MDKIRITSKPQNFSPQEGHQVHFNFDAYMHDEPNAEQASSYSTYAFSPVDNALKASTDVFLRVYGVLGYNRSTGKSFLGIMNLFHDQEPTRIADQIRTRIRALCKEDPQDTEVVFFGGNVTEPGGKQGLTFEHEQIRDWMKEIPELKEGEQWQILKPTDEYQMQQQLGVLFDGAQEKLIIAPVESPDT